MFKMSSGLRLAIGLVTIGVLAFFGVYFWTRGQQTLGAVSFGLGGLRILLLVVGRLSSRRRQAEIEAAMRREEQAFMEELRAKRGEGPSESGGEESARDASPPESPPEGSEAEVDG